MPEEEVKSPKNTVSDANKIVQQESTRNKKFEDVRFDAYRDAGGKLMYRKFDGGSIAGRFTQSEMDKGIGERKEDSFYEFDKTLLTEKALNPSQDDSLSMDLDINVPEGGGGGSGGDDISAIMIINGFPTSVTLKGNIPDD